MAMLCDDHCASVSINFARLLGGQRLMANLDWDAISLQAGLQRCLQVTRCPESICGAFAKIRVILEDQRHAIQPPGQ